MKIKNILCTGCAACSQICPQKCISMEMNSQGFQIPVINEANCVDCGLCQKVCPIVHTDVRGKGDMSVYGCKLKNQEDICKSTSGGAFYALGCQALNKGGVVYGAAYNENMMVEHIGVTDLQGLNRLRKSKYVQSDIKNTYREAEEYLKGGRLVVYSGTPCQIAGLNGYLGKEYVNLLKVEVFCHSISSPGVWKDYLKQRQRDKDSKIVAVDFRAKETEENTSGNYGIARSGWKNPYFILGFESGEMFAEKMESNLFLKGFSNGLSTRLSCHECKFKLMMRTSGADFSLGDFWGIETVDSGFFDEKGVSVMICHTDRASAYLEEVENDLDVRKFSLKEVLPGNKELCDPAPAHGEREAFFREYAEGNKDIDGLLQKHLGYFASRPSLSLRIGLLGSHNTRRAINTICAGSKCSLAYQFCNTNLISMFARSCELPGDISEISNPFRAEMLRADWEKCFIRDIDKILENTDFLCIDFLEERFEVVQYNNSLVTKSDAFCDAGIIAYEDIGMTSAYRMDLWKAACLKLISILKNKYDINRVFVVKQFLCEEYGSEKEKHSFPDREKIKEINKILSDCYTFFIQESKIQNIIDICDTGIRFTDINHRHGCISCHTNLMHNSLVADYLYKAMSKAID